jgi:hypothetical protein
MVVSNATMNCAVAMASMAGPGGRSILRCLPARGRGGAGDMRLDVTADARPARTP